MSKRLANLASKISISSIDIGGAKRAVVEGRDGCIGIGEEDEVSLAVSIVLVTRKSREEGLELDSDGGQRIGELPVFSPGESTIIGDEVITGISSGEEGEARIVRKVNWAELKVR